MKRQIIQESRDRKKIGVRKQRGHSPSRHFQDSIRLASLHGWICGPNLLTFL